MAWHRPKFTRSNRIDGRGIRAYKDKKDVAYQTSLALEATSAMMRWTHENGEQWNAEGEWALDVEFHVHDLRRRDADNLIKQAMDALSTICYKDDEQVVRLSVAKYLNRKHPKTIVTVSRVHGYLEEQSAQAGLGLGSP